MAGRVENLKPQNTRTKAEQKKIARMGGKASGKARAEKKKLSEFYAEALAREYEIEVSPAVIKEVKRATACRSRFRDDARPLRHGDC